jgi:hemolysin activation/secretion protein
VYNRLAVENPNGDFDPDFLASTRVDDRPSEPGSSGDWMLSSRRVGLIGLALLLLAGALLPSLARAQADVLPGAERPELKPFAPEEPTPEPLELPPIPAPADDRAGRLSTGLSVLVESFRIEGSSVFSAEELERLTAPYTGRAISSEELLLARDAITNYYIEHGYLTSGAMVPDQDVADGIVTIEVVEGVLADVEVLGTSRFRPGYFRTRLRRAGRTPVNIGQIEEQLQRFQRDARVERVRAQLNPGARRGESVLTLDVEENRFYGLALAFANDNSPGVGSTTGHFEPSVSNLIGYGDELSSSIQISEGLRQYNASFAVPLPPFDTRLVLHYQHSDSDVVEEPFDIVDIESRSTTYGITLDQPILRTSAHEIRLGATAEYRKSKTVVLDQCYSFVFGTGDCTNEVSVVRMFAGWTWATPTTVVAARSTLSVGVHALGSSDRRSPLPDSEFVAWLGQLQWAHRLPKKLLRAEIVTRFDVQLANDALVGIEKFAVGGMRTVRGYRENQYVRDNGLVASVELRVPVLYDRGGRAVAQLVPFVDYGRSWNEEGITSTENIASIGVGLRASPWEWLRAELYWGGRLKKAPKVSYDIQNDGIHFAIVFIPF